MTKQTSVQKRLKTIKIDEDVHARLERQGRYKESLGDIISRALDALEQQETKSKK